MTGPTTTSASANTDFLSRWFCARRFKFARVLQICAECGCYSGCVGQPAERRRRGRPDVILRRVLGAAPFGSSATQMATAFEGALMRTWFITGVSSGLGRAIAAAALAADDRVVGTVRKEEDRVTFSAQAPGRSIGVLLDFTDQD